MVTNADEAFKVLNKVVNRWQHLESRTLQNGTLLFGHVPHVAPEAYFHLIFPPLIPTEIEFLEKKVQSPLPEDVKQFLLSTNGIRLFSNAFNIYGLRANYERTGDAAWQPFDMSTANVSERPKDAGENLVFIGGYSQDGSRLFIDKDSGRVYRAARYTVEPLNEWEGFFEMLSSEALRLSALFDDTGRRIDKTVPLTPGSRSE